MQYVSRRVSSLTEALCVHTQKKCSFCKKEKCSPKYTLYDNKKQSQNWLGKQLRLLAVCFYALMGEKCSSSSTCLCPTLSVNTGEKSTVHLTWWQTQKWLDSVHSFTTHPNFPSLFFYKNISPYKRQLGIYIFFFATAIQPLTLNISV